MIMPDYEFYNKTYGGTLPKEIFDRLAKRSEYYVKKLVTKYDAEAEVIQMAICAVADAMNQNETGGQVASESVGSWKRTFFENESKTGERALYDAAMLYLDGTEYVRRVRWC